MKDHSYLSPIIIIVMLTLSVPCYLYGGEENNVRSNSISSGSWAVQFAVKSYVTLDNFSGLFSIKHHLSDNSALRVGMGYTQSYEITDPLNSGFTNDTNHKEYDYSASLVYLRYPSSDKNVMLYWGLGPEFGYQLEENYSQSYTYRDRRYTVGVQGIIGFEWFAMKEISFHAEYQPRVYYSDLSGYYSGDHNPYTGHGWYAETNRVLFGLSAYF